MNYRSLNVGYGCFAGADRVRKIHISRTRAKIDYPAHFQLIAAMNPSPTGHYQGHHNRASPEQTLRYLGRLSGPFLDRFDLSLEIPLPPRGA
jgi:magnesium chelatase family protein